MVSGIRLDLRFLSQLPSSNGLEVHRYQGKGRYISSATLHVRTGRAQTGQTGHFVSNFLNLLGQLVPAKFFGITRKSIKPALDDSAFQLEEETKKEREEREQREQERTRRHERGGVEDDSLSEEAEDLQDQERRERIKEKRQKSWLPVM